MTGNVIAPGKTTNEIVEGGVLIAGRLAQFDIGKSIERVRPLVAQYKTVTVQIVRELYFVRKYLAGQEGQRKDPSADDYIPYTWNGYCEAIGLSRQAANGWLRRFTPAELSDTGEDRLLAPEEIKALSLPAPPAPREQESRIAQVMAGGKRPPGWTNADERALRERLSAQKTEKMQTLFSGRLGRRPRQDYYAEIAALARGRRRFALKEQNQLDAQNTMFAAIHDYLDLFPDKESLLGAAVNLADRIHTAANYLAELRAADTDGQE
jgi:hypothetical protein